MAFNWNTDMWWADNTLQGSAIGGSESPLMLDTCTDLWPPDLYLSECGTLSATLSSPTPFNLDDLLSNELLASISPQILPRPYPDNHCAPTPSISELESLALEYSAGSEQSPTGAGQTFPRHSSYDSYHPSNEDELSTGSCASDEEPEATTPRSESSIRSENASRRRLRTTNRVRKVIPPTSSIRTRSKSPPTDNAHKTKRRHNEVEKKYRNRLNGLFERLFAVLPSTLAEHANPGDTDMTISKGEILEQATVRIGALEKENDLLNCEINRLATQLMQVQKIGLN